MELQIFDVSRVFAGTSAITLRAPSPALPAHHCLQVRRTVVHPDAGESRKSQYHLSIILGANPMKKLIPFVFVGLALLILGAGWLYITLLHMGLP